MLGEIARRADDIPVLRCALCDLAFTGALPNDIARFYDGDYFHAADDATQTIGYDDYALAYPPWNFRWLTLLLARLVHGGGRLLDIGCASGEFLVMARADGFAGFGSEIHGGAAEEAKSKGFHVVSGPFSADDWSPGFNVVTMLEVLEHVTNLRRFLVSARDLTAPDGILVFLVPNLSDALISRYGATNYAFVNSLEHTYYFNARAIRSICTELFGADSLTLMEIEDVPAGDQSTAYMLGVLRVTPGVDKPEQQVATALADGVVEGLRAEERLILALLAARFGRHALADAAIAGVRDHRDQEDFDLIRAQVCLHKGAVHQALAITTPHFLAAAQRESSVAALQMSASLSGWLQLHGLSGDIASGVSEIDVRIGQEQGMAGAHAVEANRETPGA